MKRVIIDAGHGGVFDGWYCTPGKRSPEPPPEGIYEGAYNREIGALLSARLTHLGISTALINPGPMDTPESAKAAYGREVARKFGGANVLWLSLHCNASPRAGWDEQARGATIFVKRSDSQSEAIAKKILAAWSAGTGISGTRGVQKKGFNILFAAPVSALLEMGFMTSKQDLALMRSQFPSGIAAVAEVIKEWYDEQ